MSVRDKKAHLEDVETGERLLAPLDEIEPASDDRLVVASATVLPNAQSA